MNSKDNSIKSPKQIEKKKKDWGCEPVGQKQFVRQEKDRSHSDDGGREQGKSF